MNWFNLLTQSVFVRKALPQSSHLNGWFPSWTDSICLLVVYFSEKHACFTNVTFAWLFSFHEQYVHSVVLFFEIMHDKYCNWTMNPESWTTVLANRAFMRFFPSCTDSTCVFKLNNCNHKYSNCQNYF